jgi:formylglycine-generating enzyme required for sulfatase activity
MTQLIKKSILVMALFIMLFSGCLTKKIPKDLGGGNAAFSPDFESDSSFTNTLQMKFIWIRQGSFLMGSPESEPGHNKSQVQHQVTLTRGFYMQTNEVTVGQWRAFILETGYKTEAEIGQSANSWRGSPDPWTGSHWSTKAGTYWDNPDFSQTESHPVTCVTWNDVQKFISWLNRKDNRSYRLPTNAEWEYACRAGNTNSRFWGDNPDNACRYANVADQDFKRKFNQVRIQIHKCEDGYIETAPVGSFQPNAFGLYDMIGNVMEWCSDWSRYGDYPTGSDTDPVGPSSGEGRIIRGGGWTSSVEICRSANQGMAIPSTRHNTLGFRIVSP